MWGGQNIGDNKLGSCGDVKGHEVNIKYLDVRRLEDGIHYSGKALM